MDQVPARPVEHGPAHAFPALAIINSTFGDLARNIILSHIVLSSSRATSSGIGRQGHGDAAALERSVENGGLDDLAGPLGTLGVVERLALVVARLAIIIAAVPRQGLVVEVDLVGGELREGDPAIGPRALGRLLVRLEPVVLGDGPSLSFTELSAGAAARS